MQKVVQELQTHKDCFQVKRAVIRSRRKSNKVREINRSLQSQRRKIRLKLGQRQNGK